MFTFTQVYNTVQILDYKKNAGSSAMLLCEPNIASGSPYGSFQGLLGRGDNFQDGDNI